jgi:hypothetical protein
MSEPVELARITIVKRYDDDADGGEAIVTTYSDGLSLVDALGMLAFAQATTLPTYLDDDEQEG